MKLLDAVVLLIIAVLSDPTYSQSNSNLRLVEHHGMPYSFKYVVKDDASDNNFGYEEKSDGKLVTGSYRVLLPDRRIQIVTYHVDGDSGYVADVRYEEVPNTSTGTSSFKTPTNAFLKDSNESPSGISAPTNSDQAIGIDPALSIDIRAKLALESTVIPSESHEHPSFKNYDSQPVYSSAVPPFETSSFEDSSIEIHAGLPFGNSDRTSLKLPASFESNEESFTNITSLPVFDTEAETGPSLQTYPGSSFQTHQESVTRTDDRPSSKLPTSFVSGTEPFTDTPVPDLNTNTETGSLIENIFGQPSENKPEPLIETEPVIRPTNSPLPNFDANVETGPPFEFHTVGPYIDSPLKPDSPRNILEEVDGGILPLDGQSLSGQSDSGVTQSFESIPLPVYDTLEEAGSSFETNTGRSTESYAEPYLEYLPPPDYETFAAPTVENLPGTFDEHHSVPSDEAFAVPEFEALPKAIYDNPSVSLDEGLPIPVYSTLSTIDETFVQPVVENQYSETRGVSASEQHFEPHPALTNENSYSFDFEPHLVPVDANPISPVDNLLAPVYEASKVLDFETFLEHELSTSFVDENPSAPVDDHLPIPVYKDPALPVEEPFIPPASDIHMVPDLAVNPVTVYDTPSTYDKHYEATPTENLPAQVNGNPTVPALGSIQALISHELSSTLDTLPGPVYRNPIPIFKNFPFNFFDEIPLNLEPNPASILEKPSSTVDETVATPAIENSAWVLDGLSSNSDTHPPPVYDTPSLPFDETAIENLPASVSEGFSADFQPHPSHVYAASSLALDENSATPTSGYLPPPVYNDPTASVIENLPASVPEKFSTDSQSHPSPVYDAASLAHDENSATPNLGYLPPPLYNDPTTPVIENLRASVPEEFSSDSQSYPAPVYDAPPPPHDDNCVTPASGHLPSPVYKDPTVPAIENLSSSVSEGLSSNLQSHPAPVYDTSSLANDGTFVGPASWNIPVPVHRDPTVPTIENLQASVPEEFSSDSESYPAPVYRDPTVPAIKNLQASIPEGFSTDSQPYPAPVYRDPSVPVIENLPASVPEGFSSDSNPHPSPIYDASSPLYNENYATLGNPPTPACSDPTVAAIKNLPASVPEGFSTDSQSYPAPVYRDPTVAAIENLPVPVPEGISSDSQPYPAPVYRDPTLPAIEVLPASVSEGFSSDSQSYPAPVYRDPTVAAIENLPVPVPEGFSSDSQPFRAPAYRGPTVPAIENLPTSVSEGFSSIIQSHPSPVYDAPSLAHDEIFVLPDSWDIPPPVYRDPTVPAPENLPASVLEGFTSDSQPYPAPVYDTSPLPHDETFVAPALENLPPPVYDTSLVPSFESPILPVHDSSSPSDHNGNLPAPVYKLQAESTDENLTSSPIEILPTPVFKASSVCEALICAASDPNLLPFIPIYSDTNTFSAAPIVPALFYRTTAFPAAGHADPPLPQPV